MDRMQRWRWLVSLGRAAPGALAVALVAGMAFTSGCSLGNDSQPLRAARPSQPAPESETTEAPMTEPAAYGPRDREIQVAVGETFEIELEANPGTGYEWHLDLDEDHLRLVEREFRRPPAEAEPKERPRPGAPGLEVFRFEALRAGRSELHADYRRKWEKEPTKEVDFVVDILSEPR